MSDPVNHPKHYNQGEIETITYIDQVCSHYFGDEAFSIGNVIRYISRGPHKGDKLQDLQKAAWYLNHTIELIEAFEKTHQPKTRQTTDCFPDATPTPTPTSDPDPFDAGAPENTPEAESESESRSRARRPRRKK